MQTKQKLKVFWEVIEGFDDLEIYSYCVILPTHTNRDAFNVNVNTMRGKDNAVFTDKPNNTNTSKTS